MAMLAGFINGFEPGKCFALSINFLMTAFAFDRLVSAFKFESGIAVMIEFARKPISRSMATAAVRYCHRGAVYINSFFKLTLMGIIMAAFTGFFQSGKPQIMIGNILLDRNMAFPAGNCQMLALETEACQFMIERNLFPGIDVMTILTAIGFGVFIGLTGMRILVAIGTAA